MPTGSLVTQPVTKRARSIVALREAVAGWWGEAVVNRRKLSKTLSHDDVRKLRGAMLHASLIDRELDTLVTFSPWRDQRGVAQNPDTVADAFRRFLKHVGMWAARHTGGPFTAIRVCHADEDGSRP